MKKTFYILFSFVFVLNACKTSFTTISSFKSIERLLDTSSVLKQHHTGFVLQEIGSDKILVQKNADKYFTPASNTKLFTFYAALNILQDSIKALQYVIRADSLIIWPTADPSFLHPLFKDQKAFDFIKNSGKSVYIVTGRYHGDKFGSGWSWNDYNDDYQAEITEFPVFANMIHIHADTNAMLSVKPNLSDLFMGDKKTDTTLKNVKRDINSNNLLVPAIFSKDFKQTIPLHFDKTTFVNLLSDTLLGTGLIIKEAEVLTWRNLPPDAKTIYSTKADTLYRNMLLPSDNFLAEQLLLNCAVSLNVEMKTDVVIDAITRKYLGNPPHKIQWVDGSGLSRFNLFTPMDIAFLLQNIYKKIGNEQRLFSLLPAGGKTGTLKNLYKSQTPFIYAKTGSLSNNHNLSGYLIGKTGKKYVFSFMNNNFIRPSADIRSEMERILTQIHENF